MFKRLFSPSPVSTKKVAEEKVNVKGKTQNQIIEEIHDTFYTEVDRLLASAKIARSLDTDKQDLIDKCARLRKLGFTNTQEVKEAEIEIERLSALEKENREKQYLMEAIDHFSFKYPHYKFITEDSVKKICAKYGLVYSEISRYTGTVPDRNLKHIEDFKVLDEDICCFEEETRFSAFDDRVKMRFISYSKLNYNLQEVHGNQRFGTNYRIRYGVCPLEIAAPFKDFNMDQAELKNFKISTIVDKDPIVLQPVHYRGQKHYLIVTAWGLEASDSLVMNPVHN